MSTRWKVNLIPVERVARVLVGLVAAVGGAYLLGGAGSTLAIAVEAIVIITGMDLVVTGLTGHCPLYQKLGFVPARLKGRVP
jgi:hypothetical protein